MPELSIDQVVEQVSTHWQDFHPRRTVIRNWRDIRYGRDDVLNTIPEELRSTDFEYHSMQFNSAVFDLTAFLSAAKQTWTVDPQRDADRKKVDVEEQIIRAIFGPNGVLDTESGGEVSFAVWQNQCENGQGVYKFLLKRDYPLAMPQRIFADEVGDFPDAKFEDNPDFNGHSRKSTRVDRRQTRNRESDDSLDARRDDFMEGEFPFEWRSVDPLNTVPITHDGVVVARVEMTARRATILKEHGHFDLMDVDQGFVYLSEPQGDTEMGRSTGSTGLVVNTFEFWTATHGYFGFMSKQQDSTTGHHKIVLSKEIKSWTHPYGRVPYYEANGLINTDHDLAFRWAGAFDAMISETPLLNHLESMHFNAIQRGFFPLYYPVKDQGFRGEPAPMEAEQMVGVTHSDMERVELPPGWKWEVMPSGFEPDLTFQLQSARERVGESAIAAVLTGSSPGAGDSGAKISLLINAAARSISPFVRHHVAPLQEMATMMLDTAKRMKLDLSVTIDEREPDGSTRAKRLTLKATDIVSTAVRLSLNIALPVDEAAQESRGMTLVQQGMMSYDRAAPIFLGIGDPEAERDHIAIEKREAQLDDVAFQTAVMDFEQRAPSIFAGFFGNVEPLEAPDGSVGGGPGGTFGGASTNIGRGQTAQPSATQLDVGGP